MHIDTLVLSGYKRLMLNNIQQITFTPRSVYQLILGTNGSGKSSILHELSPLPSNSRHYIKGGFKRIDISHEGETYSLTSDFSKSGSGVHTFHRTTDGKREDLNPGNTAAVQKNLAEQIFRITPAIHNLLIGKIKFTDLTPAKRREWITFICSADYTYALGVYSNLKSAARDTQGALKHNKQRLFSETAKLENIHDLTEVEERYQRVHSELSVLLLNQTSSVRNTFVRELEEQYQAHMQRLREVSSDIIKDTFAVKNFIQSANIFSLQDIESQLEYLRSQEAIKVALRDQTGEEFQKIESLIQDLKANNVEDAASLKTQMEELQRKIGHQHSKVSHYTTVKADPKAAKQAASEAIEQLILCLKQLPANKDRRFTKKSVDQAQQQLSIEQRRKDKHLNTVASLEKQRDHLLSLKEQVCPKCEHRWVPGRSENEVKRLENAIKGEGDLAKKAQRTIQDITQFLEEADEYRQQYAALRRLVQTYPRLTDLWDVLLQDTRLMDDPASLIPEVHQYTRDIAVHANLSDLNSKRERLETLLESANQTGGNGASLEKHMASLQEKLHSIAVELERLQQDKAQYQRLHRSVKRYLEKGELLDVLLEESEGLVKDLVEGERQAILQETIEGHQLELAKLQQSRNEKATLEGIIDNLTKDKDILERDQKALSLLANVLSPTDGLIAEQLMGFIDSFVGHVNQFIASVWTYELKVKGCGVDGGDLDYKFPFSVNDGQGTLNVPDISEGSEAQLEIINLAFRLVTMLYLKLEEYPLFLDELGRSFDEQHRRNVMDFIKRLTDGANYTQLFMISHFAAEYGAFTQADVLVLDDTNIAAPAKHNEHVEII